MTFGGSLWRFFPFVALDWKGGARVRSDFNFPGALLISKGAVLTLPWAWTRGAHLRCRFPGSMSHGFCGPTFSLGVMFPND